MGEKAHAASKVPQLILHIDPTVALAEKDQTLGDLNFLGAVML